MNEWAFFITAHGYIFIYIFIQMYFYNNLLLCKINFNFLCKQATF